MPIPRRYWDSSVFIAWLAPEPQRVPACREVLTAAAKGELMIVTSALTLAEVIRLKSKQAIPRQQQAKVNRFFLNEYISVRAVDRAIAELARELIWAHGVPAKDAVHLATAIRFKVPTLDTFDDKDFGSLDRQLGTPPIAIGPPRMDQRTISFEPPLEPTAPDAGSES